jgi:hypothetical protein
MGIKESKEAEAAPEITPHMIRETVKALEAKGLAHYMDSGVYAPTESGWKLLMETKDAKEEIIAYGHPNITATHRTTLEITKSIEIKRDADCIIGVRASKSCKDLSREIRNALKNGNKVEMIMEADGVTEKIVAFGSPALKLTNDEDIVMRKSDFIDNRTLAILADKAACDLEKEFVEKLKDPTTEIKITLEIKS